MATDKNGRHLDIADFVRVCEMDDLKYVEVIGDGFIALDGEMMFKDAKNHYWKIEKVMGAEEEISDKIARIMKDAKELQEWEMAYQYSLMKKAG